MTIASAEFIWRSAQKRVCGHKSLYLIITHHHSDYVFGMRVLKRKGIARLERLKKLNIWTVIPGHGNLCSTSEIDRNIDFLAKKLKSN